MEEQIIRIIMLGLHDSGLTSFADSIRSDPPVYFAKNPTYDPGPNVINVDFGLHRFGKSSSLYLLGFQDKEWNLLFSGLSRFDDMQIFISSIDGFVVLVDSANLNVLPHVQPILNQVRRLNKDHGKPYTLFANKQDRQDALGISQLRDRLQLEADEVLIPCSGIDEEGAMAAIFATRIKLPDESSVQPIEQILQHSL